MGSMVNKDGAKVFDPTFALQEEGVAVPQPIELPNPESLGFSLFDKRPAVTTNPKDLIGDTKIDLSLVPPAAMLYAARAMMDGAKKYGPYNWRDNPVRLRVYVAALQRHLSQFLDGEDVDPISNVPHLGHALACAAIMVDAIETGNAVDDRPKAGPAARLIRENTK